MVAFLASYFPGQWKVRFLHHARATSPMELAHSWSFKPCKKRREKNNCNRKKTDHTRNLSNCTHPTRPRTKIWADHPKPQGCYLIARLDQLTNGLDQWTHGLDQWTPKECTTTAPFEPLVEKTGRRRREDGYQDP